MCDDSKFTHASVQDFDVGGPKVDHGSHPPHEGRQNSGGSDGEPNLVKVAVFSSLMVWPFFQPRSWVVSVTSGGLRRFLPDFFVMVFFSLGLWWGYQATSCRVHLSTLQSRYLTWRNLTFYKFDLIIQFIYSQRLEIWNVTLYQTFQNILILIL